jgi:hypothetical protein
LQNNNKYIDLKNNVEETEADNKTDITLIKHSGVHDNLAKYYKNEKLSEG